MTDQGRERIKREKDFHNETFSTNSRMAAKKYYKSTNISKEYYRESILKDINNKYVLEYGCGPGSSTFDLARSGAKVHAIDISEVAIKQTLDQAAEENLTINASVMNAENLVFDKGSFDLVCGSGILHHLDLERSYKEIHRVLKSDGRAVFFEPLGHNPIINLYRLLTPKMRTEDEHPLLMSDIKLAEKYFINVKATHFNLTAIAATLLPTLSGFFSKTDEMIFKIIPYLKRHSWIVVLEFSNPK